MVEQAVLILIWILAFPFLATILLSLFPRLISGLSGKERLSAQKAPLFLAAAVCLVCAAIALLIRPALTSPEPLEAVFGWVREPFHFRLRVDSLNLLVFFAIAIASTLVLCF